MSRRESCVKKTRSAAGKPDRYMKINQIYIHNYRINGIYIRKVWEYDRINLIHITKYVQKYDQRTNTKISHERDPINTILSQ